MRYVLIAAFLLTSCIQYQRPTNNIQQTLPLAADDTAIYAGCVRAVARLVIRSKAYRVWPPEEIAIFCEDVRRSFETERKNAERGRV